MAAAQVQDAVATPCMHETLLAGSCAATILAGPAAFSKIYREECVLCFRTHDDLDGINLCLTCYQGGCEEHAKLHFGKCAHPLAINIRRFGADPMDADIAATSTTTPATSNTANAGDDTHMDSEEQRAVKITKLEIPAQPEKDNYAFEFGIRCLACRKQWSMDADEAVPLVPVVETLMHEATARLRSDLQAWSEQVVPCDHSLCAASYRQQEESAAPPTDTCGLCDKRDNLWLCMRCGFVGCGRRQFDGSGGNGHAASHHASTSHPIACKLGTITSAGSADIYCYTCDEMRIDTMLETHLASLGISIAAAKKTEQSMAELQLQQNLNFDFPMVGEDGNQFEPASGPSILGLTNLGNSCYLAAVMQACLALPAFHAFYGGQRAQDHFERCKRDAPACLTCQMCKLILAAERGGPRESLSGQQAHGHNRADAVSPWMFKAVVASGHQAFSTARQQDASEFFSRVLECINRSDPQLAPSTNSRSHPVTAVFDFGLQQVVRCAQCNKTRHSAVIKSSALTLCLADAQRMALERGSSADTISLSDCITSYFEEESVPINCDHCSSTSALKSFRMTFMPEVLVITLARFVEKDHVSQKLDLPVDIPLESLDLERFYSSAVKSEATSNTGTSSNAAASSHAGPSQSQAEPDAGAMAQLESMGFPTAKCRRALLACGGSDVEAATQWLFDRLDNDDNDNCSNDAEKGPAVMADEETLLSGAKRLSMDDAQKATVPPEYISMLTDAGFPHERAEQALLATDLDVERAFDWLLSHPATAAADSNPITTGHDNIGDSSSMLIGESSIGSGGASSPNLPDLAFKYDLAAFISHRGPSLNSGHYVAHTLDPRKEHEKGWLMFNDEKVVQVPADQLPTKHAYIYFFTRSPLSKP